MELKMQLSGQIMDNVAEEIIELIFARLPVKCLLRLKCLSKNWYSIISSPRFAQVQYNIGPCTEKLFYVDTSEYYHHRLISYDFNHSVHKDSAYAVLPSPFSAFIHYSKRIRVIGSCRGFLLVAHLHCTDASQGRTIIDTMCMWNPSTGFKKFLQGPPVDALEVFRSTYLYLTGFGYDPSTKDYLIVVIESYYYKYNFSVKVYIFSVRDNAWKETEGKSIKNFIGPLSPLNYDGVGTYFNSALHWITSYAILTFNLSQRSFTEIRLPLDLKTCNYYCLKVYGDSLGLFTSRYWENDSYSVCIRVMEEYNNADSWKIIFYVSSVYDIFLNGSCNTRFMPMCCTQSGYLFISYPFSHAMGKWDKNGNIQEGRCSREKFKMPCVRSHAVVYRESLLSL